MKKVLSFTLVSLALAALCAPAYAGKFGGSIRGDVGTTGSQVPFFGITTNTGVAPNVLQDTVTFYSDRDDAQWDFTGRLFFYTNCSPCCGTYIAGSWQGSNHTVDSCATNLESATSLSIIPVLRGSVFDVEYVIPTVGSPVLATVHVKNEFSKAKLGFGFDLIKTSCFAFTMEVGGNYLDTKLDTDKLYAITRTVAQGQGTLVVPGATLLSAPLASLPYDFLIHVDEREKTEGAGIYAMFKGEYKFPASCLGNCFSIYGKAEVADIIGRQSYDYDYFFENAFVLDDTIAVALVPPTTFCFEQHPERRYNNIVEVDLEAALVYSPCFKCWDNLNMSFALGIRTDSFVNLFAHRTVEGHQSILSLARPTAFLEIGIKV